VRLTLLELPATWGEPRRVLDEVDARLGAAPPGDLVLLPEASLTGYVSPRGDFDLRRFAEPDDGPTAQAIAALARRHATTLVAPLILDEGGRAYNAIRAVGPDGGVRFTYRKRHPWLPETWAEAGREPPPLVEIGGLQVTICICYDIHFVAAEAAASLAAADLLLFPSAWVDEHATRVPLLRGLARRFDLAVANANWAPGVVRLPGQGGSIVLDRDGAALAEVTAGQPRADVTLAFRTAK
jgi:predicted amidohydrolase